MTAARATLPQDPHHRPTNSLLRLDQRAPPASALRIFTGPGYSALVTRTVPRLLCLLFFMLHSVAARVPPLFARRRPAQMPYSDAASRWWAAGSVNFAVLPVKQ